MILEQYYIGHCPQNEYNIHNSTQYKIILSYTKSLHIIKVSNLDQDFKTLT